MYAAVDHHVFAAGVGQREMFGEDRPPFSTGLTISYTLLSGRFASAVPVSTKHATAVTSSEAQLAKFTL